MPLYLEERDQLRMVGMWLDTEARAHIPEPSRPCSPEMFCLWIAVSDLANRLVQSKATRTRKRHQFGYPSIVSNGPDIQCSFLVKPYTLAGLKVDLVHTMSAC